MVSQDSELSVYLDQGDNRNARLLTKMVAARLNRLPRHDVDVDDVDDVDDEDRIRFKIRESILEALVGMPVRNEVGIVVIERRFSKARVCAAYTRLVCTRAA